MRSKDEILTKLEQHLTEIGSLLEELRDLPSSTPAPSVPKAQLFMTTKSSNKHILTCDKCGFSWRTKSTRMYVTCTNCKGAVRNTEYNPEKP